MIRPLPIVIAAALVAPARAAAQAYYYGPTETLEYRPELRRDAPFGRCEPCDVDGDAATDQLTLRGSLAFLTLSPEYLGCVTPIVVTDAIDVAVWHRAAGGEPDAIIVSDSKGLELATYDVDAGLVECRALAPTVMAERLRLADADGDGDEELFALIGSGTRVVVIDLATELLVETLELPRPALDFVVLDWDARTAPYHVAAVGRRGIDVVARGATSACYSETDTFDASLIARVRRRDGGDGAASDGLARVVELQLPDEPWPRQWLAVHYADEHELPIELGWTQCSSLIPVDIEGDGDDDLALGIRYSHEVLLAFNRTSDGRPEGTTFTSQEIGYAVAPLGPIGGAADSAAAPSLADLDGDGDLDLFMNLESQESYVTIKSPLACDESALAIMPGDSRFCEQPDGSWMLELALQPPAQVAAGANALEVVVWRQPTVDAELELASCYRAILPFPDWSSAEDGNATIHVPFAEGGWFESIYYFSVRTVDLEDGRLAHGFPASTFAFTTDESTRDVLVERSGHEGYMAVTLEPQSKPKGAFAWTCVCGGFGGGLICWPSIFPFPFGRGPH